VWHVDRDHGAQNVSLLRGEEALVHSSDSNAGCRRAT
jgi:hypothetical protein